MSVWKLVVVSRPVLGLNFTYHQHQPQSPLKRGQRSLHLIWIFLLKFVFMNGKSLVMASKLLKHFLTTLHPGKRPLASIADLEGGPTLPVRPCNAEESFSPAERLEPLDSTFLWNFSDPGILWLCLGQGAVEIQLNSSNWRLHCVDWLALKFYGLFVIFAGMSLFFDVTETFKGSLSTEMSTYCPVERHVVNSCLTRWGLSHARQTALTLTQHISVMQTDTSPGSLGSQPACSL